MALCPTCSSPTVEQWKVCATCGNPLTSFINPEHLQPAPKKKTPWLWIGIGGGAVVAISAVVILASTVMSANSGSSAPVPTPTAIESPEIQNPVSAAEELQKKLIQENICTSAWAFEDYVESPSFGIDPTFWESGDVRVCQVDRTSKAATRWVTVITGQSLLQDFGPSWDVPYGSVAITDTNWTIVTDTQTTESDISDDPVVQAILAKLGGSYKLSSE